MYKNLFQNVNFYFQIFIYSQKEDLDNYFNSLNKNFPKENELKTEYTNFLKSLIIKGLKEESANQAKELIKELEPLDVIKEYMIPALDYVGKGFENGTVFLPQLCWAM